MENIVIKITNGGYVVFDFTNGKVMYNGAYQKEILFNEIEEVNLSAKNDYCAFICQGGEFANFYTYDTTGLYNAIMQLKSVNSGIIIEDAYYKSRSNASNNANAQSANVESDHTNNYVKIYATIIMILGFVGSLVLAVFLKNVLLFFAGFFGVLYLSVLMYALGDIIMYLERIEKNTHKQ